MLHVKITNDNGSVLTRDFNNQEEIDAWLEMESKKKNSALGKFEKELIVEPDTNLYPNLASYVEEVTVSEYALDEQGEYIESLDSTEEDRKYEMLDVVKHKVRIPGTFSIEITDITSQVQKERLESQISSMIDFGMKLIRDFSVENSLLGIRSDDMIRTVRVNMQEVTNALMVGDLTGAIEDLQELSADKKDAKYITDARMNDFIDRIVAFLATI